ncbi:rab9 effector [Labeo rohita]|uniref:Rab9 effector protein with kelch motifs n=2 Tax=Labeo rohita TaxID=84645 RepID=A0A498NQJ2_LABRO|nr:Rab9 effector protein with kelch motifs [Labeo rohita]RXN34235.1 rab9 effector [Labeo rohita]
MELLPVLDPQERPQSRHWYVVVPTGAGPGVCVGHTCTFLPSSDGGKGRIVIVGGANPDGSFSDSYFINLGSALTSGMLHEWDTHEWDIPDWDGLQARYEHCSFVPESDPQSLWVFAGAEKNGNRNCVQVLRTSADAEGRGLWQTVQVKGTAPSVRTYHTSSACVGDRLYVFSGGDAGASPVSDPQLHVFDTVSATWLQPECKGTPPAPRQGHVITAVGSGIYIHGGMAGDKFHNDMFLLNTETMKWEKVRAKGDIPPGVAAHSSLTFGKNIFIFGGMTADGATNAMYKFQCDKQRWTRMKFDGDLPPSRLDHSMCVVPWRVKTPEESRDADVVHLCFIFGGMDTQGIIFNDCLVTVLT